MDVQDVLSFALTCSFLRPVATKRLLSMHPINLVGAPFVERFHTFLFADTAPHAPHVRALRIHNWRPLRFPPRDMAELASPTIASLLVQIITSCLQLTDISICARFDSIHDRPILAAIAALQTLRSLTIDGWSTDALHLLRNLSSPLRNLSIPDFPGADPASLEEFLLHLAQTLQELRLTYFRPRQSAVDNVPGSPDFFRNRTRYPAVRSLSLHRIEGPPRLDRLQHFFPALDGTLFISMSNPGTRARERTRAANRHAQDGSSSHSAWKTLDRVVCSPSTLHILALRCPVRHVMLNLDDDPDLPWLRYAAEALRENPVPRLKLALRYRRGMFDGLFTPELAGTLSRLTLCLLYDNDADNVENPMTEDDAADLAQLRWGDLLDTITSSLRPLHNLTHLRVVLYCKIIIQRPAESASESSATSTSSISGSLPHPYTYSEGFVDAVRGPAFDFAGAAAALVRTLPPLSLQYVFLTTCGAFVDRGEAARKVNSGRPLARERWSVGRGWRVANANVNAGSDNLPQAGMGKSSADGTHDDSEDGDPDLPSGGLVELHGDVADTLVRNEGLVLSEMDEFLLSGFPDDDPCT